MILDESAAPVPSIQDTWLPSLAITAYGRFTGKQLSARSQEQAEEVELLEATGDESEGAAATPSAGLGSRPAATKAGGKRRKTAAKKK